MKRYFNKTLLGAVCGLLFLTACKKNYSDVYFEGGTAPVLTSTVSDSIPLNFADSSNTAVTFSWTNPNYKFSNGVSSLNVTYYLQIDTLGGNFSSPIAQTISISSDLSKTYKVSEFNTLLLNMFLATGQPHDLQVRINSFLGANQGSYFSNTLGFKVTPYVIPPAVPVPLTGTLFITGDATQDGWMVGGDPTSVANQQMTQVSQTLYKITLPLIGGKQFLLVPAAGDWSNKYATSDGSSPPTGGTFGYNKSNNFNGPASSGTYTVSFNFQTGFYSISQ